MSSSVWNPIQALQSALRKRIERSTDVSDQPPPHKRPKPDVDTDVSAPIPPGHFRFFDLPSELRIHVYKYFLEDMDYELKVGWWNYIRNRQELLPRLSVAGGYFLPHPSTIALLAVNHQTRFEVAPIVFATKVTYEITSWGGLRNFTRNIGDLGLERIQQLTIIWGNNLIDAMRKKPSVLEMLLRFSRLKHIHLVIVLGWDWRAILENLPPTKLAKMHGLKQLHAAGIAVDIVIRESIRFTSPGRSDAWREAVINAMEIGA